MKTLFVSVFVLILCSPLNAQWEKIGYPGGYHSLYQYDSALFAFSYFDVYRSTDDGDSWESWSKGLPRSEFCGVSYVGTSNRIMTSRISSGSTYIFNKYKDSVFAMRSKDDNWHSYTQAIFSDNAEPNFGRDTLLNEMYRKNDSSGYSIYVSVDSGKTWEHRVNGLPDTDVYGYTIGISKKRIFIAVHNPFVYYDIDSIQYSDVKYEGCYYTDDVGLNWNRLTATDTNTNSQTLYFPNRNDMYCWNQGYYNKMSFKKSTDNGSTWVHASNGIDSRVYSILSLSDFGGEMFLSVRIINKNDDSMHCYHSTDRGISWIKLPQLTSASQYESVIYKRHYKNDGYILRSKLSKTYYLLLDNQFRIVSDFIFHPNPYAGNIASVHNGHIIAYNAPSDSSTESFDYGTTWGKTKNLSDSNVYYISFFEPGDVQIKVEANGGSRYYSSTNNGSSWELIKFPYEPISDADPVVGVYKDTMVLYYYRDSLRGNTYMSTNGGGSWYEINTPFLTPTHITDISINKYGILMYHQATSDYSFSSNGGSQWSQGDGYLTGDNYDNPVEYVPFDYLYGIGARNYYTQLGYDTTLPYIRRASKSDNIWSNLQTNLPNYVYPIQLHSFKNILFLLSYAFEDRKNHDGSTRVFVSYNSGETWLQLGDAMPTGNKMLFNDKYIYVASADYYGCLYRYPLALAGIHDSKPNSNNSLTLSAYPNPATKEITISHTSEQAEWVVMYDMTGVLVKSDVVRDQTTWDVSELPSGSYMLGIPGGKMQVVQVVK